MNSSVRPRTPSSLSDSLHHQLNMYALAASAAGVSALSLVQPSEAEIVYTKAHTVIHGRNDYVGLDLTHDGFADFTLFIRGAPYPGYGMELGISPPFTSSTFNSIRQSQLGAIAYRAGARIGSNLRAEPLRRVHPPALMELAYYASTCVGCEPRGNWLDVRNRYLGLVFMINGKIHYGWARLNASVGESSGIRALLTGYAYETVPNKAIITGKTKGPDVVAVEPATLGKLALGRK